MSESNVISKSELGLKIRQLREMKKMSRMDFCGDETRLSVKQLARIESGKSLPSINSILFISQRLNISVSDLVDTEKFMLSPRYNELKSLLLRGFIYGNPQQTQKYMEIFTEIELKFFNTLSEEEQLQIQILKTLHIKDYPNRLNFIDEIIQDYFQQVRKKSRFSENDLMILSMYYLHTYHHPYEQEIFDNFLTQLFAQSINAMNLEANLVNRTLYAAASTLIKDKRYHKLFDLTDISIALMVRNSDFQRMPVALMLQGKYWLLEKQDEIKAGEKYQEASQLARLQQDTFLAEKIMVEWEVDFKLKSA
ncbi:MAG: helix-turn-helix domain-containing protein [Turicibacter sp.]|nr:helix-turn-helix domain-containing protein [Turicibacter sp.]